MLMDHFIGLIISPCPLNNDGWSCLIWYFLIFYWLPILRSGWILSELDVLLIGYDFVKIDGHRLSWSIVMFFPIIWGWAFTPKFWRWMGSILLKGRNIGKDTCYLSVAHFFLLRWECHCVLHVDQGVKVVDGIELVLLFFRLRFTLRLWLFILRIFMNWPFSGATWFHNVNI